MCPRDNSCDSFIIHYLLKKKSIIFNSLKPHEIVLFLFPSFQLDLACTKCYYYESIALRFEGYDRKSIIIPEINTQSLEEVL